MRDELKGGTCGVLCGTDNDMPNGITVGCKVVVENCYGYKEIFKVTGETDTYWILYGNWGGKYVSKEILCNKSDLKMYDGDEYYDKIISADKDMVKAVRDDNNKSGVINQIRASSWNLLALKDLREIHRLISEKTKNIDK